MKVAVQVKDKSEGERLQEAISDPATRALMNVVAALMPLGTRDRQRVLAFVENSFSDDQPSHPGPVAATRELVGV